MLSAVKIGTALRHNYRELVFVFAAFALMALSAYVLIGNILESRLLSRTKEMIQTGEANVRAGLSEAETTLLNSYYIMQGMIEHNASRQEMLDYLTVTTEWMRRREQGLLRYYGIYGYINGEFYDSMGLNPGSDYLPQKRPWYQAAVRSGNAIAYTAPYEDLRTGEIIVSVVRTIDHAAGGTAGILAVDVNINWLMEYIGALALAPGGHGMLISQNMTLMAHPDGRYIGRQLQSLGGAYEDIARTLRRGEDVFARRVTYADGSSVIVFFNRIFNGWYIGSVTPYFQFYRDLYVSALILALLGIGLSCLLGYILLRLSAAKLRADEESKFKSSFLANMSHEIRTPLNAVLGMAAIGAKAQDITGKNQAFTKIEGASHHLLDIINDILDMSKIEAGKFELSDIVFQVRELVARVESIMRFKANEKKLEFAVSVADTVPDSLYGDDIRLAQVITNLVGNAIKFTPETGRVSLSVSLDGEAKGLCTVRFLVQDTGIGITKEQKTKLFDSFQQAESSTTRKYGGTGLGLALSKRIVEFMGGEILVDSEPGRGSAFSFTITAPRAEMTPEGGISENAPQETQAGEFADHVILLADDVEINREIVLSLLEETGLVIDTAENGEKAVKLFEQDPDRYRLILMDLQMPIMDGYEASRRIRAGNSPHAATVPIIAMTANVFREDIENCLACGMNAHLGKPVELDKLLGLLRRYLQPVT